MLFLLSLVVKTSDERKPSRVSERGYPFFEKMVPATMACAHAHTMRRSIESRAPRPDDRESGRPSHSESRPQSADTAAAARATMHTVAMRGNFNSKLKETRQRTERHLSGET